MLEPVALQHSAFRAPGLLQDSRGVVVGSQAALLCYSLERLVSALRLLSCEAAFSDLLPTLRIEEVRNALSARGYVLRFACSDSRTLDRCAAAAAASLGTLCVGAERHFVAYRDRRAPLGYDARELSKEAGDYVFYTAAATQAYVRIAELPLLQLISRLEILPQPGGVAAARLEGSTAPLWLLVPSGLLRRVLRFFWQRGVATAAALPDPLFAETPSGRALRSSANGSSAELALIELPPGSLAPSRLQLFLSSPGIPGVRALAPIAEHLAVELGHAHPLRLFALERLFPRDRRTLFLSGERSALSLSATPFIAAEHLIELRYELLPPPHDKRIEREAPLLRTVEKEPAFAEGEVPLRLKLRLHPEPTPSEPPVAALVPWSKARSLVRMLGLLPPPLFSELRAACIDEGVLIVGDSGSIASLPLGQLFYAAAPSVLTPLGMSLVPRLRGDLLQRVVRVPQAGYVLFLPDALPFSLQREAFGPLSSLFLKRLQPEERPAAREPASPSPTVVNDPLPLLWPLWGGPKLPSSPPLLAERSPQKGGKS